MDAHRKIAQMREERAGHMAAMRSIHARAEGRDLNAGEAREFARHEARFDALTDSIKSMEAEHGLTLDPSGVRSIATPDTAERRAGADASDLRNADGSVKRGGLLAAELRAVSTGAGIGQALTPIEQANAVWEALEHRAVVLQAARENGGVILRTENASINLPHETGDTLSLSSWAAEGADIVPTDPDGEGREVTPRKAAVVVKASNESVEDSTPEVVANVEARVMRALALRVDHGFINGTGTAPEPKGLASYTIANAVAAAGALANLDPFADVLGQVITAGADEENVAWFLAPRDWAALLMLKESSTSNVPLLVNQYVDPTGGVKRSILGRPVYLTPAIPTNGGAGTNESSAYAADMARVAVVVRTDAKVEVDQSAAFTSDSVYIRGKARIAYDVPDLGALGEVAGITP
jgi:HK97 family phage major capsid protein